MTLEGKVAFVTGAARNVGKGVTTALAQHGAHVVLNDIDREGLDVLSTALEGDGLSVSTAYGDIGDPDTAVSLIDEAASEYGSLDILVNNAVIHVGKGERGVFLQVRPEGVLG